MSEDVLQTDAQPVVPNLPDRADAPVSEVTERFLRAVIAEIPVARIEELHLFSPLRQGTLETGIAVIALRASSPVPQADGDEAPELEPELPFTEAADEVITDEVVADEVIADEVIADEVVAENLITVDTPADDESPYADEPLEETVLVAEVVSEEEIADVVAEEVFETTVAENHSGDVHLPDATGTPEDTPEDESADMDDDADEAAADAMSDAVIVVETPPRPARHTVYTARYRYIIKGPERGKWESSVKAEADAPLITVETVVRGVQRRAGEESEIVRYSGAQIARALRIPLD